jgi:hypothetical protein
MQSFVIGVYKDWCRELKWTEGTSTQNTFTPAGAPQTAQEYQLPDTTIKIFRVYLNGQRLAETSIFLLEGDVIRAYDATWTIFPRVNAPQLVAGSQLSIPITSGPGFAQFSYYIRGGFVGFLPGPASDGIPIRIEGAFIPPDPAATDTLLLPDQWKFGLAYGAIYRFLLGDRRVQEAKAWQLLEQEQWGMAMRWRRDMGGQDQQPMVIPQPYRIWYGRANARPQTTPNFVFNF